MRYDKRLLSLIYKELIKIDKKNIKIPVKKEGKRHE